MTVDLPLTDMVSHMVEESPNECVGLVLGDGTIVKLINQARSTDRFFVGASQISELFEDVDEDIIATYHSHPSSPAIPSGEDQKFMAFISLVWPDVYHIILSNHGHMAYHVGEDLDIERISWPTTIPR